MVAALIKAALLGKEVTKPSSNCGPDLMKRQNIDLATQLQDAGANVVYGIVGYKTHAKCFSSSDGKGSSSPICSSRYGELSHRHGPALHRFQLYDLRKDVTADVHRLFTQLTGLGQAERLIALLQAPFTLRDGMLQLIDAEAQAARANQPARSDSEGELNQ